MGSSYYLEVKTLHIILVVSWFAGLFYLPRLFVNLAMVPADSTAERDRLLLMAGKLYRFMTPIGYLALISGLWLWLGVGISGPWLHAKLTLVVGLFVSHGLAMRYRQKLLVDPHAVRHQTFRVLNEVPTLLMIGIVIMIIVRPWQR